MVNFFKSFAAHFEFSPEVDECFYLMVVEILRLLRPEEPVLVFWSGVSIMRAAVVADIIERWVSSATDMSTLLSSNCDIEMFDRLTWSAGRPPPGAA